MNRLLAGALGWSLAWLATSAVAGEGALRTIATSSPSAAQPSNAQPAVGVMLGRPQPLPAGTVPTSDVTPPSGVQPVAFAELATPAPTVRGKSSESSLFTAPQPVAFADLELAAPPGRGSAFATGASRTSPTPSGFGVAWGSVMAPPLVPVPAATTAPAAAPAAAPATTPARAKASADAGCLGCTSTDPAYSDCCACCDEGCCLNRWYVRGEYLLWWIRPPRFPALATTGTEASQGDLGAPGTVVLFGGGTEHYDPFSGGRLTVGWWCDPCQKWGIEFSGFVLGQQSIKFAADSSQFPIITRPFFNINEGREDSEITARPGVASGALLINAPSQLWGAELNVRCNLCGGCCWRLDSLTGFRYLDLRESVNITESVTVLQADPFRAVGDHALVFDDFATRNQFYGGQLGLDWEWRHNRWIVDVRAKLGLGVTHQTITINGGQVVTRAAGGQETFVGGLLALPSNIGRFERNRFSVVPELGVNIGYQFTDHLTAYVGYTFLDWTNVVRPGDQIDRVLDINQIPNFRGTANPPAPQVRPLVPFRETNFWAQGLNVGLEYKW